jgi:exopolyphosphatase/guanosine-5'-triphosphate,3'-diphosphate pyrophosphatase
MRVATIDIGTNTVLLLIAEVERDGSLSAIEERATITRLGEGVDQTRTLSAAAIERTNTCLSSYAEAVRAAGADRVAVVGTSAMRDASGGEGVRLHVKKALGVEARVISGEEEARLTFAGAVSGLGLPAGEITVFDIGGGSTEVVAGRVDARGAPQAITFARSFDIGSVRLTERHVRSDPPTPEELDALRLAADTELTGLAPGSGPDSLGGTGPIVGIAGTMTTLAAVSLEMASYDGARVHGHVMLRREIDRVVRELAAKPLRERRSVSGLEPKRADVIVAGGIIALGVLTRLGAERVRISDRGVRWGLAEVLAQAP